MKVETVMYPSPPTWIKARITPWPKGDQKWGVSTTIRPVTQTAEVAVNRAAIRGGLSPTAVAYGSMRRPVPTKMHPA
jgi:hypothetical protein